MVTLAVNSETSVRTAAVALADETLSHFIILVCFVASFGETYPCELVNCVETLHELLQSPHICRVEKLVEERNDAVRVFESDLWVL